MLATTNHLDATLIVFVLSLAFIDWRTHRIPNVLCAVAAMFGLTFQVGIHGEAGLMAGLGGAAVGFAMFIPFYVLRAFGAGDVKAMATVGIFLGVQSTLLAVGITLVAGGVLGALTLWLRPVYAGTTLHRVIGMLLSPVATARNTTGAATPRPRLRFPYGVAIACGAVGALIVKAH